MIWGKTDFKDPTESSLMFYLPKPANLGVKMFSIPTAWFRLSQNRKDQCFTLSSRVLSGWA